MPSAHNLIGLFEKLESVNITIHQHRCVRVRNRNATCHRCADACTSGCISFSANELSIDPTQCIGCATCATVCPTCALEARKPGDAQLYEQAKAAMCAAEGKAVIAASQILYAARNVVDKEKVTEVTNLGRVDETLIVRLAAAGASQVVLVQPHEVGAAEAKGIQTAEAVCASANELLEAWGFACEARLAKRFPSSVRRSDVPEYNEGRRNFFVEMCEDAKETATAFADVAARGALGIKEQPADSHALYKRLSVMEDGTIPHFIPDRREMLLDTLAGKGEPDDRELRGRLWGHVVIDTDACSGCRMCATFCPTGALFKYDGEDGQTGVGHTAGDCVKCLCCQDICPRGALVVHDGVPARDVLAGEVVNYPMEPEADKRSNPDSILNSMKTLLGAGQLFDRC